MIHNFLKKTATSYPNNKNPVTIFNNFNKNT